MSDLRNGNQDDFVEAALDLANALYERVVQRKEFPVGDVIEGLWDAVDEMDVADDERKAHLTDVVSALEEATRPWR